MGTNRLVFEKFEELGSAYSVFRYLTVKDLQLGFRRQRGGVSARIGMAACVFYADLAILGDTPIYSGAYAHGLASPRKESRDGTRRRGEVVLAPGM